MTKYPSIRGEPFRYRTRESNDVVSFDELPMETTTPSADSRSIAAASDEPPADSRIMSNGSPSGSNPTTTSFAPSSAKPAARSGRPTMPVTWAPPRWASCTANRPTPPAAPVMATRVPRSAPCRASVPSAVRPATGSVAATSKPRSSGSSARWSVRTATRSAHDPPTTHPTTRAPASGPVPSAACCTTTPAKSHPGRHPSSVCCRSVMHSPRFRETARTWTSAWFGAGSGSGTSRSSMPPGAPGAARSARTST